MHRYKDNTGREWPIDLDVPMLERIRDALDFDLLTPLSAQKQDENVFQSIVHSPQRLIDVCYFVNAKQFEKEGISDVEFARRLSPSADDEGESPQELLHQMSMAFFKEYMRFFPREFRAKMTARIETLTTRMEAEVPQEIDTELDEEMENLILEAKVREAERASERQAKHDALMARLKQTTNGKTPTNGTTRKEGGDSSTNSAESSESATVEA